MDKGVRGIVFAAAFLRPEAGKSAVFVEAAVFSC